MSWLIALIGEIFVISEEFKFYKKKKEQRAYEKANKLPKKRMLSPLTEAFVIVPMILIAVTFLFYSFINPVKQERDTRDTLRTMSYLLHLEKTQKGVYPKNIIELSRKNPTYGDLTKDAWEREIIYEATENGKDYLLLSKGKDGVLHTEDDISETILKENIQNYLND
ncbi:MAG: hypothetical protein AAF611_05590 [Bacteroidota bacterium]